MASSQSLEHWKDKAMRAQAANRSLREVANEAGDMFADAAESGGTALIMGYVQGQGGYEIGGLVPLEVAVSLVGTGVALATDGELAKHARRVGLGAGNAFLTQLGFGIGQQRKKKAKE